MDNRLYVTFYLNKHGGNSDKYSIYLRITIAQIREAVSTGIYVTKDEWDAAKSKVRKSAEDSMSKNRLLKALETKATDCYTECITKGLPLTARQVKMMLTKADDLCETLNTLFSHHNLYILKQVGHGITYATYRKYQIVFSKVSEFLQKEMKRNDIPLDQLNKAFAMRFELFLKADHNIGHNTTIKYIQALKKVINYGIGMEWLKYDPLKAFKCTLLQEPVKLTT